MPLPLKHQLESLPLVLVVRGLVCLSLFLAACGLFADNYRAALQLPFVATQAAAKELLGYPQDLDTYGSMFGFLVLHLLLVTAVWFFLRTGLEFFEAKINESGSSPQAGPSGRWAALVFLVAGIVNDLATLGLLTQLERGDWPGWLVWTLRVAAFGKWAALAVNLAAQISLWRKGMDVDPHWLVNSQFREAFRMAFFLRVPLTCTFLLGLTVPIALGPARPFLEATLFFEANGGGLLAFTLTVFTAFLVALAATAQISILLRRGHERFDAEDYSDDARSRLCGLFQESALLAALSLGLSTATYSIANWENSPGWVALVPAAAFVGVAGAFSVVFLGDWIRNYLTSQQQKAAGAARLTSFLVLGDNWLGRLWNRWLQSALDRTAQSYLTDNPLTRILPWFIRRLHPVGFASEKGHGAPYPDIMGAIWILVLFSISFVVTVIWSLNAEKALNTLASLLLLILFLGWLLAGFAFILDRYRFPVLPAALAVRFVLGLVSCDTDHRFLHEGPPATVAMTPRQMLLGHPRPILVAASGGGIQAAAWMTSIMEKLRQDSQLDFKNRVALISAVSGGSVGAYLLGAQWDQPDWTKPRENARQTSLGRAAWALVGLDFFRPLVAWTPYKNWDRGYALEQDLELRVHSPVPDAAPDTLAGWSQRAAEGKLPVFLFNTTVVETGGPVAFATGEFPSTEFENKHPNPLASKHVSLSERRFFAAQCKDLKAGDIHAATAARLSATFPYVSPAARPDGKFSDCNYQFVDGGYYDNYGLVSLLQWLDDALESMTEVERDHVGPITIVVIRGRIDEGQMPAREWTFTDQTTAPISAFLAMRSYGQWAGGSGALRLVKEKWSQRNVAIVESLVDYPTVAKNPDQPLCSQEPLTWKLTPRQQKCIDYQTEHVKITGIADAVAPR